MLVQEFNSWTSYSSYHSLLCPVQGAAATFNGRYRIMQERGHILVIRNGAIGDTILLAPVIHAFRNHFPHREIVILGQYERVSLLVGPSFASRAMSFELPGIHTLYGPSPSLSAEVRDLFASAALILWYGEDRDGQLTRNLTDLCPGQVVVHSPRPSEDQHVIDHLFEPLNQLGIARPLKVPSLQISARLPEDLENLLGAPERQSPWIAIHPGASKAEKRLPIPVWADVLHGLARERFIRVAVLAGAEEERLGIDLCAAVNELNPRSIHNRPLMDIAAVLRKMSMYVGNDSGITHLAAALGCPTLAVFRSTDPHVWAPVGINAKALESRPQEDSLAAERIITELKGL